MKRQRCNLPNLENKEGVCIFAFCASARWGRWIMDGRTEPCTAGTPENYFYRADEFFTSSLCYFKYITCALKNKTKKNRNEHEDKMQRPRDKME